MFIEFNSYIVLEKLVFIACDFIWFQGIIAAIESMFPRACRRICVVDFSEELCESLSRSKAQSIDDESQQCIQYMDSQEGHESST